MFDTITVPRVVVEQALEAFEIHARQYPHMVKGYTLDAEEALRAALKQPDIEIPASVPEGWKLVPVEPTDDMLYDIQEFSHILPPRGRRIWAHMLAAAPQPPTIKQSLTIRQPQVEQEPFTVLVRKHSWLDNQWEVGPQGNLDYGRAWADERINVYTHPQPPRQPLTDAEILMVLDAADIPDLPRDFKDVDIDIARAIERAHGIGE